MQKCIVLIIANCLFVHVVNMLERLDVACNYFLVSKQENFEIALLNMYVSSLLLRLLCISWYHFLRSVKLCATIGRNVYYITHVQVHPRAWTWD